MIKLNINKMELPVFDIIQATPFRIPLKENFNLFFEVPSVDEYFTFEAKYLKAIHKHFILFAKVYFLELKEFKSLKLKEAFLKELKFAIQNEKFKKDLREIIVKYFTADFDINKIMSVANPFQIGYLVMFIHGIVENVKSFFFTGSEKDGSSDLGDLFYFFEYTFHKNRTEILAMPITYAMLLVDKYNKAQKAAKKSRPKIKIKAKKK